MLLILAFGSKRVAQQQHGKVHGAIYRRLILWSGCNQRLLIVLLDARFLLDFAAASTLIRIRSRAARSNNRPCAITAVICLLFRMSWSGFALSNTKSALLPGSIEPMLFSILRNFAGLLVAVCNDSIVVKPASTKLASSSCKLNPGMT